MEISGTIVAASKGGLIETNCTCACVNISTGGVAVDAPEPMAVGAFVTLGPQSYGPRRLARVRHCVQGGDSYRIGFQFIDSQ